MAHRVRIQPFDRDIEVAADQTILECALFEGIDYPFSCQQGQCGSCKSLLIEGEVEMGDHYNPLALPAEERARGMILACQAQPRADCVVAVLEQDGRIVHTVRDLECRIVAVAPALPGRSVVILAIEHGGPFNFVAGQRADVRVAEGPSMRLAMAGTPADAQLSFHFLHPPQAPPAWSPGTPVSVRGPFGETYLHDEHLGPIVAVADTAGLAAMLAIARTAIALGLPQRIRLYALGDTALADWLTTDPALRAGSRRLTIVTAPDEGALLDRIAADCDDAAACRAYVAGSAHLVARTRALFIARGLAPEHFAAEESP